MRRVKIDGDLSLSDKGYSSGGFMADVHVGGTLIPGTQQQFMFRNVNMSSWIGGDLNMVHVGNVNAPDTHCGVANFSGSITNVERTPIIAEKPYIIFDGSAYKLMVPNIERNKLGTTPNFKNAKMIPFSNVFVANESNTAA